MILMALNTLIVRYVVASHSGSQKLENERRAKPTKHSLDLNRRVSARPQIDVFRG